VGKTVASLLRQDYPGGFSVILVDDQSRDGTAAAAREAAAALGAAGRLTVLPGRTLPAGWTGKLWAQQQGVELAEKLPMPPDYLLFTDADIVYAPDALSRLVARARQGGLVLEEFEGGDAVGTCLERAVFDVRRHHDHLTGKILDPGREP